MGLDTFFKVNIFQRTNKSLGDDTLILNRNVEFYMNCIKNKEITKTEAALKLNCSRQWVTEIYRRFSNNETLEKQKTHRQKILSDDIQNKLLRLYKHLSYDLNGILHTPSMEILKSIAIDTIDDFPDIHIQTIRDYLKLNKHYPKNIKSRKYRKRFEAKYVGELIQGDVCTHQWIPSLNRKFPIILFIDDKSRYILYAKFVTSDNLENHITALKNMFLTFGLPLAIYYDNDSKYSYIRHGGMHFDQRTESPELVIPNALKEVGVNLINSKPFQPQGKGKVERKFLTFQGQIPHYMILENAKNIDEANAVLEKYVIKHNNTYSRAINATPEAVFKNNYDTFKDINKKDLDKIENSFTKRVIRRVSNVNEISYHNELFLVPRYNNCSLANYEVEVRENPNKWIKIFYKDCLLTKYDIGGIL
jgi:putative transposase